VALFHVLPLALDAAAIRVMQSEAHRGAMASALLVRWIGESANSLMPAGQIGGPLLMIRQLIQRGASPADAVAAITVSTTLQSIAQIAFALLGVAILIARSARGPTLWVAVLIATGCLIVPLTAFYFLQRRGRLFTGSLRLAQRFAGARDLSHWVQHAQGIDIAVQAAYRRRTRTGQSFALSLIGWVVGTGEVWLVLRLLGSAVSWGDALVLESLGQAIRGASFAIPGSLGVQEGGYLLLAPFAGLRSDVALGLSLAKRARELLLGVPGLIFLHFSERAFRRRASAGAPSE
jgi:putative membrane protein